MCAIFAFVKPANGQVREVHKGEYLKDIKKISFYSSSEGYAAYEKELRFTTDTGHTLNFAYNWQFLELKGVKAFNRDTVFVYGGTDYGRKPAIHYSADGGKSFKSVFYRYDGDWESIKDIAFSADHKTGYAVSDHWVLKSTDGGLSWNQIYRNEHTSDYAQIQVFDKNKVCATTGIGTNGSMGVSITSDGGKTWERVKMPQLGVSAVHFLTPEKGWYNASGDVYRTTNAGKTWIQQNDPAVYFTAGRMHFINDSTGYAFSGNGLYKTSNYGKIWEPIPNAKKINDNYRQITDIELKNNQIWVAGEDEYIGLNTDGGITIPKAIFEMDESGVASGGPVKLINKSRSGYKYQWFKNGKPLGSTYHISYPTDIYAPDDTIQLVTSNAKYTDTATQYTRYSKKVTIYGFSPKTGPRSTEVEIWGKNFENITGVSFGGVPGYFIWVLSPTRITARVADGGATGPITVTSKTTSGSSKDNFTFIPPPQITSVSPMMAAAGTKVTITGSGFEDIEWVSFGGVQAKVFNVISPTKIEAIVPGGRSGDVRILSNKTGLGIFPGFVTIPVITGLGPAESGYGDHMSIAGTGLGNVTSVTIDGYPVLKFSAGDDLHITLGEGTTGVINLITPNGTYSYKAFTYVKTPIIHSYSPITASAGETVTITGQNFSSAGNNIVYFGAARAQILSANATTITVQVPAGATYDLLNVISNKRVCYSNKPFTLTFKDGGEITTRSFGAGIELFPGNNTSRLHVGDLDNDGKTDLVWPASGANNALVNIKANKSTPGNLKFKHQYISMNGETDLDHVDGAITDWNRDGKLDVVSPVLRSQSKILSAWTNLNFDWNELYASYYSITIPAATENLDNIRFGSLPNIAATDMNKDGATDIITTVQKPFKTVTLVDVDGDGYTDVVSMNKKQIAIYRNISTKASIAYASPFFINLDDELHSIAAADLDGNSTNDLIAGTANGKVIIINNSSTTGNIVFTRGAEYTGFVYTATVAAGDVNGDGKPDMVVGAQQQLRVYQNTSAKGKITFGAPATFSGRTSLNIALADLDGDSRPEIITDEGAILRNLIGTPQITSFTPGGGEEGTTVTIKGGDFTGATAVSIGGVDVRAFTVNSATSITAVVDTGAKGYIAITTPKATGNSLTEFKFVPVPRIVTYDPKTFNYGDSALLYLSGLDDTYTYEWKRNGITIPGAGKASYYAKTSGSYTLSLSYQNSTKLTSQAIDIKTILVLPQNNLKVSASSAVCRGDSSGAIHIVADAAMDYVATLGTRSYPFTKTLDINGLAAGTHYVCVTAQQGDYQHCFTLIITEPEQLFVTSAVNRSLNSVDLQLGGADVYNISLNNTEFKISQNNISLPLREGLNELTIATGKYCQGTVKKLINISARVNPFPNPFRDVLNINIGTGAVKHARIRLSEINTGRLVYDKVFTNQAGSIPVNTPDIPNGIYVLSVTIDNTEDIFKVIKE